MSNCVFARRRYNSKIPTFNELFATVSTYTTSYRNQSSSAVASFSAPSSAVAGQTWYLFFACGSSLEISRIDMIDSTHMTKNRLAIRYVTGQTAQTTSLNAEGTSISTDNGTYANNRIFLRFNGTYSNNIIDYMFTNANYATTKYYYSSTAITSSTAFDNLAIYKSVFDGYTSGVCFCTWYSQLNNGSLVWAVVDATNATSNIEGGVASSWMTGNAFRQATTGSGDAVICAKSDPNNSTSTGYPYTRTFTVKRIYENW